MRSLSTTFGAVLWLACCQYFIVEAIAQHAWPVPYSLGGNYISDLGTARSPLHGLMNASLLLQGGLIVLGAGLVAPLLPAGWTGRIALWLIAISGFGVAAVGLAPSDAISQVHYAAAAEHFLTGNLGMVLLGLALARLGAGFSLYTLASGAVGLAGTVLIFEGMSLGLGVGGIERVAAYPFPLWLTLAGLYLLWRRPQAA